MEIDQKALAMVADKGKRLTAEALDFLEKLDTSVNLNDLLNNAVKTAEGLFITVEVLKEIIDKIHTEIEVPPSAPVFTPEAKDIESRVRVLDDPGSRIEPGSTVEDFLSLFRSRFKRLSSIIACRLGIRSFQSIGDTLMLKQGETTLTVGLVAAKRETRNGILLEIEDLQSKMTVYVGKRTVQAFHIARQVPLDSVIAVKVRKVDERFIVADEVFLPEAENRKPSRSDEEVYAVLTSDLHVGSKFFLEELFQHFISWLIGKYGNGWAREVASKIKYIVIAGDLIDGVGVYPGQKEELEEFKVKAQYEKVANLINQIPDYIHIIILPGNHDAVRRALPQPAIPINYAEKLYEKTNITMLGNPVNISLHDVNIYCFHGRSLDDCISTIPGLKQHKVSEAMRVLLRVRHIAPTYGLLSRISPQGFDDLIIPVSPDIFHAGHIHINDYTQHNNVLIVNSGTWQRQTYFQRERGIIPTPGIVPLVNLASLEVKNVRFI